MNEQLGSLMFALAHQLRKLSQYLSASGLDYLKIRIFITYWSLQAVNIKEIFNYYRHDKLTLN